MAEKAKKIEPRILIVDDTPKNIQVLGTILRQENYQINVATNGVQCLKMAEKVVPDLILLDIMMPEMDGFEACKRLKEDPKTNEIPVIFLSAKTETEDIVHGFELGAGDFVTKPFNASELLARVKTHLEIKKNREIIESQAVERRELIHVLCHDLTNPIVGIKGMLELIDEAEELEEMKSYVPFLKTGTLNALDIITLIRKMQELEGEKLRWDLTGVNLKEALDECASIIKLKLEEKKLELIVNIDPALNVVAEKTSLINSVFNNLFSNAMKFSHEGSKIEVSANTDEVGKVIVAIKDHGIGMSERLVEKVFDIKESTNRKGTKGEEGTGFGMPLVYKFVSAYNGVVEIESSDDGANHGTTVKITFDRAKSDD